MKLQEKIKIDMAFAMKNRNQEELDLLRVVSGEFSRVGKELSDDEAIKVIRKMSDNAKDQGNDSEVKILDKYLPEMLGEKQIKTIVAGIINKNKFSGIKDMGKVMGEIKKLPTASQIDGKLSSKITKKLLG